MKNYIKFFYISFMFFILSCVNIGKCVDGNCKNGKGTFIYSSREEAPKLYFDSSPHTHDSKGAYSGEWVNGQRNGFGKMIYFSEDEYQGQWKNDLQNGWGVYKTKFGFKYEGYWSAGQYEGKGSLIFYDGSKYEGSWRFSMPDGEGVFTLSNGVKIKGQWFRGSPADDSIITIIFKDGYEYSGVWKISHSTSLSKTSSSNNDICIRGNNINGNAVVLSSQGFIYFGKYKNGVRNGFGIIYEVFENFQAYIGEWRDDKFQGDGEFLYLKFFYKYKGQFNNFEYHGYGLLEVDNVFIYSGEFYYGKKDGFGEITFGKYDYREEGTTYEGYFKSGYFHGWGVFKKKDGFKQEGYWSLDKYLGKKLIVKGDCKNGFGVYTLEDGSRYEGEFKDGKKNGNGIFIYGSKSKTFDNEVRYDGNWKNDCMDGVGTMIYTDSKYIGEWKRDYKHGNGIMYDKNNMEIYNGEWFVDEKIQN